MSYETELRVKYRAKTRRMGELIARGNLNTREREEAATISRELESIDNKLAGLETPDYRGVTAVRSPEDEAFTRFLRTGNTSGLKEVRADGTGFSTAPNDAGVSAGTTGNYAGYMVPQGF